MSVRSQKTTLARKETFTPEWLHVDATDKVLGRMATRVAQMLMGKHKPTYTPHVDTGDFVVVTNCAKVRVTGNKLDQTTYDTYSHYPGGLKRTPRRQIFEQRPDLLVRLAVKRMLPKSPLGRHMLKKLKAYAGNEHPHQAQQPVATSN
jgi:large subunit ribosomal protein L13